MVKKNDNKKELKNAAKERGCAFCKQKKEPVWLDVEALRGFLSARGRIIGKQYSGVCAKHQRHLATAIKQARHLALIPFTTTE